MALSLIQRKDAMTQRCKEDNFNAESAEKQRAYPLVYNSLQFALRELAEPAKTLRGFWLKQRAQRFMSSSSFHCASLRELCLARTLALPFVRLCGQSPAFLKNFATLRLCGEYKKDLEEIKLCTSAISAVNKKDLAVKIKGFC